MADTLIQPSDLDYQVVVYRLILCGYPVFICLSHRLIKITERTLDLCVSFTITLRQKPKAVTCSRCRTGSLSVLFYADFA